MDIVNAALIMAGGSAALAIAAFLWALRVTDGANGSLKRMQDQVRALTDQVDRADTVFGAHPGVVLIWDDPPTPGAGGGDWGTPRHYGSPLAFASLLRFADPHGGSASVPVRILQGLAALDASDATGQAARLTTALARLRREGAPFSLKITGPDGVFVELDGRTADASAVVWIIDANVRGVEDGVGRGVVGGPDANFEGIALDVSAPLRVLAQAPFMSWRVSGELKLEWANQAYLDALDAKSLGTAVARNLALDSAATDQARRVIEGGAMIDETRYCVLRGERRALRLVMMPVSGGAAAVALDVTEAEQTKEALTRQQVAHDETLNHLSEAVALFGPDRRLTFFNTAFQRLWDLDPAFLAERPTHAAWLDHLKERRKLPPHASYAEWRAAELALYHEVGEAPDVMWLLPEPRTLRVVRQRHPDGGLLLIFSDITNEVTLRSQYAQVVQTQKAALDKLHEGVAVFGLDGRMKLSNANFASMWGIDAEALSEEPTFEDVTRLCEPLFHDRATWALIRSRITDPSPQARVEFRGEMRRADGAILTFLTRPLPDGATLAAFLDVTAERQVKDALHDRAEALLAADKLKTEFIQNVSIQLRDPLQAISGNAEMLDQSMFGPLNDRQQERVRSVLEASGSLKKLIDNILDLALVEAGEIDLELAPVDVAALLRASVQFAASRAGDTEVPIRVACDPRIGAVMADEKRLTQILVNLLSNALRHTQRGDEITLAAERSEGALRLSVSDNGRGMEPEAQATAFDTFSSGDRRGAGLGLALVRSFVKLHGGWVALSSEPGRGTTVTCHLPARAPEPEPPSRSPQGGRLKRAA